MINKDKTITVADLLKMLADGRVHNRMAVTVWDQENGVSRGVQAVEIHTYEDGSQALSFFLGESCADVDQLSTSSEVFP